MCNTFSVMNINCSIECFITLYKQRRNKVEKLTVFRCYSMENNTSTQDISNNLYSLLKTKNNSRHRGRVKPSPATPAPIWVQAGLLATPAANQLHANTPGNAVEDGPTAGPLNPQKDHEETPDKRYSKIFLEK